MGTTVNSFINANMNELRMTGWMSNRGRQNVASFLINDLISNGDEELNGLKNN